jgi:DNA-binding XRE family transcriptional regulator
MITMSRIATWGSFY